MARPRISFPPGARQSLLLMATTTGLRETVAADSFGMTLANFRAAIADDERSREVWEEAQAAERDELTKVLFEKAKDGDQKSAQYLLAVKHGLSEKTPEMTNKGGVNITFQLPAALDPVAYAQAISPKLEALTDGN